MNIEPARVNEIDTVLALVEDLLAELGEEGQEFAGVDRSKLELDIRRNLDPESGRFTALLAKEEAGTAVGILTLSENFAIYAGGQYGVIDEMYVRPAYRSQGIGLQLVETALQIARGRAWFRLEVTGPENEPGTRALRFYERMGFEHTGPKLRRLV